jgi:LacI family transcriptional regulator
MKSITIIDVAKHAGVSKKTVSRVINNEVNVKKETRDKVQASVLKLGFKRNPLGIALAKNRSFFIALLSDNPSPGYLMNLQKGILKGCTEQHMGLFLYDCQYRSPSLVQEVEEFVDKTLVDGLILTPPICDKVALLEMLDRKKVSYIRIGPKNADKGEAISINASQSSNELTHYLLKLGHKDIGFIKGHPDQESSHRSELGFRNALTEANVPINETLMAQGYYTYQSGVDAAAILLNKHPRPTAIFAANDEMAVGALYQAQSQNIKVPQELSICGIDDISLSTKVWPNLTTMRHPLLEVGYQAASSLIARLENRKIIDAPSGPVNSVTFDGELVVRDSTSPPNC